MRLHTDDLTKTREEFNSLFISKEKEKEDNITTIKLSILSLVYGSTLSSTDMEELVEILSIIADYKADKEKRL